MNSQNRRTAGRFTAVAAALVLAFAPVLAEARAGKGSSFGSRGSRTESVAPRTNTAPGAAQSFQRSNPAQSTPATSAARPGAAAAAAPAAAGGMFSSPLARGIMGGLIGAGIMGMLMGSGLFSGLGSLAGIFGLLLQLALIGGLVWLAVSWWRRRQQPQMSAPMGYQRATGPDPVAPEQPQTSAPRSALGGIGGLGAIGGGAGMGAGMGAGGGSAFGTQTRPLKLDGADFERFEKVLEEVQGAYSQEDIGYLRRISTPEMATFFEEDLAEQQAKGLIAKSGGVKLLQGDLSEAWSEANGDYATVAMRYEIFDAVLERATNKVVHGDLKTPTEITEIWTFLRQHNAGPQSWVLAAIQQVEDEEQA
ncbi:MAG: TIM44-like domain-containing protein [Beijerinckiaceae bacterium]|nr:TIM44-like domain-containing protein [Beijerinckiaceae bacterium]